MDEIRNIWDKVKHQYACIEFVPEEEREKKIQALLKEVSGFFKGAFSESYLEKIKIPFEYEAFLMLTGGGQKEMKKMGTYLNTAEEAWRYTIAGFESYVVQDEWDTEEEVEEKKSELTTSGIWIEIGMWSDSDYIYICCDQNKKEFGEVHYFEEGHPCFGLPGHPVYPSFRDFLSKQIMVV